MMVFLKQFLALAVVCLLASTTQALDIGGDINGAETYTAADAPLAGNVGGDTHIRNSGVLTIDGVALGLDSFNVGDGKWNKADGVINIINGGAINRTKSGTSNSGGYFMMGSWSSGGASPRMNVLSGSTFNNDGILTFGVTGDSGALDSKLTISGGSTVDLTGGPGDGGLSNGGSFDGSDLTTADLVFAHQIGDVNDYAINFTGPGTLITDNGIEVLQQSFTLNGNIYTHTSKTYEDLWNDGILRAGNRNIGAFSDYFEVTGTAGQADYTLTSTIPEPTSMILAVMGLMSLVGLRRRSR